MKKIIFGSMLMLLTGNLFAQSMKQDDLRKPPAIPEQWKRDSIKLQLYVNINSDQMTAVKNAFISFYNSLDAVIPKEPGTHPKREDIDLLVKTRNDALKKILNEKQFDRFETFDREFLPPPPPGHDEKKMPPSQL